MIILVYLLFFVASFIATYIVSMFSAEKWNPVSVWISSFILGVWYIILGSLWLWWIIWVLFWTIFTIPVFMKFLWFDATPALWVSFLFSIVLPIVFVLILSIF